MQREGGMERARSDRKNSLPATYNLINLFISSLQLLARSVCLLHSFKLSLLPPTLS